MLFHKLLLFALLVSVHGRSMFLGGGGYSSPYSSVADTKTSSIYNGGSKLSGYYGGYNSVSNGKYSKYGIRKPNKDAEFMACADGCQRDIVRYKQWTQELGKQNEDCYNRCKAKFYPEENSGKSKLKY